MKLKMKVPTVLRWWFAGLNRLPKLIGLTIVLLACSFKAQAIELSAYPKLQAVADELISEQRYTQAELNALFAHAKVQQSVLDAMQSPAEYKFTWGKYRKLFIQPDRIQQGVDFWHQYAQELQRAEAQYGVPASMIVAIVGVESKYGKYKGKHKVLDSLVSLVVGFERRSKFFASELKEFLILTKENSLDPTEILGSYAGAVGFPQFISSSYRHYAVDFSGDGATDLINQPVDAIGSIANYFVKNGWLRGQPITSQQHLSVPQQIADLANNKRKVKHLAKDLRALGAPLATSIADDEKLNVVMMDASEIVPEKHSKDTYVVRAGDTACQIAERHNVPCKELFTVNKLNAKGAIFRGQRLKLPKGHSKSPTAVAKGGVKVEEKRTKGAWQVGNNKVGTINSNEANNETQLVQSSEPVYREMPRYFFTHENFYVITRYNQSVLYAMAVNDLSDAIHKAKMDGVPGSSGGVVSEGGN